MASTEEDMHGVREHLGDTGNWRASTLHAAVADHDDTVALAAVLGDPSVDIDHAADFVLSFAARQADSAAWERNGG